MPLAPHESRISDGVNLKGYRVFGDDSIEPPKELFGNVAKILAQDMNIDISLYVYDFGTGRLRRRMPRPQR